MKRRDRSARVLVVDDSTATLEVLRRNLTARGHSVVTAGSAMEALKALEASPIDLVITDFRMPGVDGRELTRHVTENCADVAVVMITGYGSIENAVNAMKAGAWEYLTKPFTDEELFAAVDRALEKLATQRLGRARGDGAVRAPQGLIGESAVMREVFRLIEKARGVKAPVLISGESGTGKEMVARAVHYGGPRSPAPFVPVNCGAIPEGLIESELFGYVKGAYTGADQTRAGYFQTAEGGTLFLDEIAETGTSMQVKLLRALQDGEITMVGSSRAVRVDVRIIAATNKDLAGLVSRGAFREDLYYRLNVLNIRIPPLRERGDDLLLLLRHFADRYAAEYGVRQRQFTDRALDALRRYDWPGNVREMENVVQRILVTTESDTVDVADLPRLMRFTAPRNASFPQTLEQAEAEAISRAMASAGGNKSRAAAILGIDRKTLAVKLKKLAGEIDRTGEEHPT